MASTNAQIHAPPDNEKSVGMKPIVIGIYGLPGCGKSFLLKQLKQELVQEQFRFYEGSEVLADVLPEGLDEFHKMDEDRKQHWRMKAIDKIREECSETGRVGIVVGHLSFWSAEKESAELIYTRNDLETFTHIIYLKVCPTLVAQRVSDDKERSRPSVSIEHLREWQTVEAAALNTLCRENGILLSQVCPGPGVVTKISTLVRDFRRHTEPHNLSRAIGILDEDLRFKHGLETLLVLDADRTLAANDSGALFWDEISKTNNGFCEAKSLKALFSSALGYSYLAFRQATLMCEDATTDAEFEKLCEDTASKINLHPEFVSLLGMVAKQKHVRAVVITCGLRRVWEKVMDEAGVSDVVKVIGGGRIADKIVVTSSVKAALVEHARGFYNLYVWAFGDSVLDLPMLSEADQAIVVVGEEKTRSKIMDAELLKFIENEGLQARQALLPSIASPRLDTSLLPVIDLSNQEVIDSIICIRTRYPLKVMQATHRKSTKLLMTPMRDARVAGPELQKAHHRVGWYLATEFVAELIELEEYKIPHVQGTETVGSRLCDEEQTSIVALMRGGEAMALGVHEAFPLAIFVHAKSPKDIKAHHLMRTVILVDAVINSGKTVLEFVQQIRRLNGSIPIVVVTGVANADSVHNVLEVRLARYPEISLVALRLSKNKFTGKGATDTGNRLYNTTHLD